MTMTPREIQEKQFHDAFRGYSHEEVDLFIDQVADAYDQIYRENQGFSKRLEELQGQLEGKPAPAVIPAPVTVQASTSVAGPSSSAYESEDMLKRMLLTAQETADKAVQSARAHAQTMIEESEARARRIEEQAQAISSSTLQDAQRRAAETLGAAAQEEAELQQRIEGLKTFERDFRARLGAFVKSQLELLETRPLVAAAPAPASGWERPRPDSSHPGLTAGSGRSTAGPAPWISSVVQGARAQGAAAQGAAAQGAAAQGAAAQGAAAQGAAAQGAAAQGAAAQGAAAQGAGAQGAGAQGAGAQDGPPQAPDSSESGGPASGGTGEPGSGDSALPENKSIRELFWGED